MTERNKSGEFVVEDNMVERTHLLWSPTASGQRQSVQSDGARRVQSRHALVPFVALIAFPAFFAHRALEHDKQYSISVTDRRTRTVRRWVHAL